MIFYGTVSQSHFFIFSLLFLCFIFLFTLYNRNRVKNMVKNKTVALLLATTIIFASLSAILGYNMINLSRKNSFSKNINIGNNYFLADFDEPAENADEYYLSESMVYGENEYVEEDYIFAEEVIILNENGIIDDESLNLILEILEQFGQPAASVKANEIIGKQWFTPAEYSYIIDVPYISQVGILPNGCEAVSAVMLLHYNNFNIDAVEFTDNFLEKEDVYIKWGCRYGPNPKEAYAGDPKSEKGGWGCFAPVIIKALNKYLDNQMFAKNLTGLTLDELTQQYILNDIPVAVWVTQGMNEVDSLYQWQSYDKKQTFLYPVHEHCMVLTGFDENYYYFNDPLDEEKYVKYEKSIAQKCFDFMGRQAVALV